MLADDVTRIIMAPQVARRVSCPSWESPDHSREPVRLLKGETTATAIAADMLVLYRKME